MGISFRRSGIKQSERRDANGNPFIEATKISMSLVCGKPVEVRQVVRGIKTINGENRYALRLFFMGGEYKLIVNATEIKTFVDDMQHNHVTRYKTVFFDRGGNKYGVDIEQTEILEVNGRAVEETADGRIIFSDTKEVLDFNNL